MSSKGATVFYIAFVFALGYAAQYFGFRTGALRMDGGLFNYLALLAVLFIPALGAWLASLLEKRETVTGGKYWPLPIGKTILWIVAMPVIFLAVHGITAVLGYSTFSPGLGGLVPPINDALEGMGQPQMTDSTENYVLPIVGLGAGIPLTMLLGATLFAGIALGSEIGWRGYLLPRLTRMGRLPAHVLTGLLWGLWYLPYLNAWLDLNAHLRPEAAYLIAQLLGMAVLLSVVLGEVWLRSRHMLLTAVVLGSFLAQMQGVWSFLFESPTRPWAGGAGFIGLGVWLVIALAILFTGRGQSDEPARAASEAGQPAG